MDTTLDIVPAGLALLDADGTVLSATPGFSRVLGCDASPVGHELGDLLCTLDDSDGVESALDQLSRGEAVELEAWCWRGADGPAAICLVAAPLELEDQRAVFYCLVRDVTDQRLAAEEHA
ncbi:MAG TPA: PAS domain-containing protein, partial [Gemmatimonadales bacterium]|nr:PAS domain-containing protein [Gemmatimonadales bacterium]